VPARLGHLRGEPVVVPIAPRRWQARIAGAADKLVCVHTPGDLYVVGQFYADFSQTADGVPVCLQAAVPAPRSAAAAADPPERGGEFPGAGAWRWRWSPRRDMSSWSAT